MERQLKERLIGAAVLVAAAVVMVPEMFSGARDPTLPAFDATRPSTNQIKTYRVELSSAQPAAEVELPVEPPAERPLEEAQVAATAEIAETVPVAPPPVESQQPVKITQTPSKQPAVSAPVTKPEAPKAVSVEPAVTKSGAGGWAVQIGSFSTQDKAEQIVSKLKVQGYSAFVGSVKVNGKTLYRVRVGVLADRAAADATLQKLRAAYPGASVVAPGR